MVNVNNVKKFNNVNNINKVNNVNNVNKVNNVHKRQQMSTNVNKCQQKPRNVNNTNNINNSNNVNNVKNCQQMPTMSIVLKLQKCQECNSSASLRTNFWSCLCKHHHQEREDGGLQGAPWSSEEVSWGPWEAPKSPQEFMTAPRPPGASGTKSDFVSGAGVL